MPTMARQPFSAARALRRSISPCEHSPLNAATSNASSTRSRLARTVASAKPSTSASAISSQLVARGWRYSPRRGSTSAPGTYVPGDRITWSMSILLVHGVGRNGSGLSPSHSDLLQLRGQPLTQTGKVLSMRLQLDLPILQVQRHDAGKCLWREGQPLPGQVFVARAQAKRAFLPLGLTGQAIQHPLEHAHVFAVARPEELALGVLAEPVHTVDAGRSRSALLNLGTHVQPVLKIIAHVVAAKRQHGKRVAAHHALLAKGGGRGFAAHGGGHVDTFDPVARFGHQRHRTGAAPAKDQSVNVQ